MPEGSAIAKALDYSLKRWIALTRYLDDGAVPIDTIGARIKFGRGLLGARIGCSQVRYAVVNVPQRS